MKVAFRSDRSDISVKGEAERIRERTRAFLGLQSSKCALLKWYAVSGRRRKV